MCALIIVRRNMFKKVGKIMVAIALAFVSTFMFVACGGGSEDKDYKEVSRSAKVLELGNNVDKVPSASEMVSTGKDDKKSVSTLKSSVRPLGVNDSSDEEDILVDIYPDGELSLSAYTSKIGQDLTYFNSIKLLASQLKSELFTVYPITMYNTWVDRYTTRANGVLGNPDFTSKVRMNYDVNLDVLTMEEIESYPNGNETETRYKKIISSYDINGNVLIDFYSVAYINSKPTYEYSFYYNENVIYRIAQVAYDTSLSPFGEGFTTDIYNLVEFVLEEGKEQTSMLTYNTCHGKFNDIDQEVNYGSLVAVEEKDGYNYVYEMSLGREELDNGNSESDSEALSMVTKYTNIIFDNEGKYVTEYSIDHTGDNIEIGRVEVPLYLLQGYTSVYNTCHEENSYNMYLLIGDEKYDSQRLSDIQNGIRGSVGTMTGGLYEDKQTYGNWLSFPTLELEGWKFNKNTQYSLYDIYSEYIEKIGLSFKNTQSKAVIDSSLDYYNLFNNWEMFGLTELNGLEFDEFLSKFNEYRKYTLSWENIEAMDNETCVLFDEQTSDNEIYKSIEVSDTVTVTIDSTTGAIDLSGIRITIPKRQLFVKGNSYRLVAKLVSATSSIDLTYKDVVFNDNSMTFEGFGSVTPDFASLIKDEKYTLAIYLACETSNGYQRITNDIKVNCSFESFTLNSTINEENCTITYSGSSKIIIEVNGEE